MQNLGFFQFYYDNALYLNYNSNYIVVYVDNLYIVRHDLFFVVKPKKRLAGKVLCHMKKANF